MARKALSVAEAKASLSEAIRDVEGGGTVLITRHGKPVAALVKAEDLERMLPSTMGLSRSPPRHAVGTWEVRDSCRVRAVAIHHPN